MFIAELRIENFRLFGEGDKGFTLKCCNQRDELVGDHRVPCAGDVLWLRNRFRHQCCELRHDVSGRKVGRDVYSGFGAGDIQHDSELSVRSPKL